MELGNGRLQAGTSIKRTFIQAQLGAFSETIPVTSGPEHTFIVGHVIITVPRPPHPFFLCFST